MGKITSGKNLCVYTGKHRQMLSHLTYLSGETPETPAERMNFMKKRNVLINFRMTKDEAFALTKNAAECGYSREAYIRSVLKKRIPRPMPPLEYHLMMKELHGIGNNMNQIAQKAHVLNVIDARRYDDGLKLFAEAVAKFEEAAILPVKVE
jgi:hypothetical protein